MLHGSLGETVYIHNSRSAVHRIPLGELLSLSIADLVGSNCHHWREQSYHFGHSNLITLVTADWSRAINQGYAAFQILWILIRVFDSANHVSEVLGSLILYGYCVCTPVPSALEDYASESLPLWLSWGCLRLLETVPFMHYLKPSAKSQKHQLPLLLSVVLSQQLI